MGHKNSSSLLLRLAKLFSLLLILLVFLVLFVFCTFLPRTTHSNYDTLVEKPTFSFSSLMDGSYTAQLADYFSDTVHNRDSFKEAYAKIARWFGKETVIVNENGEQEIDIGNFDHLKDESDTSSSTSSVSGNTSTPDTSGADTSSGDTPSVDTSSTETSSVETSSGTETSEEGPKEEIEVDGIFLLGTRAMEIYYGDRNLNRIPSFTETLNAFAASMPNVKVYSMPIPKACAFYLKNASAEKRTQEGNSLRDMSAIEERLSSKIKTIDIYKILNQHANEEIYFRTDHHWSSLGAFYAAKQFANDLGLPFQELSAYEKDVRAGYIGTMSTYTKQHPVIMNNPENFVTYKPKVNYTATFYDQNFQNGFEHDIFFYYNDDHRTSWYSSFLNGDAYAVRIKSGGCSNGRKLLVVKDSYGNALIPFLLYSFEEIYVVDARVFQPKLQTFVSEQGITDVLFAESLFSAVGNDYINKLKGLCG